MANKISLKTYGKEVILDIHNCDSSTFSRISIKAYFKKLCKLLDMTPERLVWWDDLYVHIKDRETEPSLVGTSAVQFIITSNITIHTLDILKNTYINVFSCKDFDGAVVKEFSAKWFRGKVVKYNVIERR